MRKIHVNLILIIFALLISIGASFSFAQKPPKPEIPKTPERVHKIVVNSSDTPAEKSIMVDAGVNISLCVSEGKLKINGWERNEIRAFVHGGSHVGFTILQKKNAQPVWVKVLGFDPTTNKEAKAEECLAGNEIELDVPRNAIVNVKSNVSEMVIDSVAKVSVENGGGDVFLNNIGRGIEARTYEGDVTVENSTGAMSLFSTTGNIIAFDVSPQEIGDIFKAKTSNGAVTLKNVGQRQIEVGSNSGSINFNGEFLTGGQYSFGTSNGSIILTIPQNSSFTINASYGYGVFASEIPLQNVEKNTPSKIQNLSAQIGKGDASLKLTTVSGAIRIRKQ
ncbi:MAG: DUF4097 domain-containing protein [Acidobacteriota bacterium]|nr:DUF4097 domain-containing protein [Acidobacteriota bacterium]